MKAKTQENALSVYMPRGWQYLALVYENYRAFSGVPIMGETVCIAANCREVKRSNKMGLFLNFGIFKDCGSGVGWPGGALEFIGCAATDYAGIG
jgi:hypothetical protein